MRSKAAISCWWTKDTVALQVARKDVGCRGATNFARRGFRSKGTPATFKQAVKGNVALSRRYARSIVFDYSYRYFYGDGYGKDYQILNLDEATEQTRLDPYLTACLLAAWQQRRLYDDKQAELAPFNLQRCCVLPVAASTPCVKMLAAKCLMSPRSSWS